MISLVRPVSALESGRRSEAKVSRTAAFKPAPIVRVAGRAADGQVWNGKRVLVTGHAGNKGAVLAEMLLALGAQVYGFGHEPHKETTHPDNRSTHELLNHAKILAGNSYGDILDERALREVFERAAPDVVFHLAAMATVEENLAHPEQAIAVNARGTGRVLEEIRRHDVPAAVMVTTDKVYGANNQETALDETAPLATSARHPYAVSKAGAAQRVNETRAMYSGTLVDARAGNIIGNDFTRSRLVPKVVQALQQSALLGINPDARRPWLHVYDVANGYLLAGEEAMRRTPEANGAFNFASAPDEAFTVRTMVDEIASRWGKNISTYDSVGERQKNSPWVLSTQKARKVLNWKPLRVGQALDLAVDWYKGATTPEKTQAITRKQIRAYLGLDRESQGRN